MFSSRIALILPDAVGAIVFGVAIIAAVVVDTRVIGLPAPSFDLTKEDMPDDSAHVPQADGLPTVPTTWCSTFVPPIDKDAVRGSQLYVADGTLVERIPVEGGDAIVRDAPGGYCMLVGPSPHIEVTTVGSWIVFTRDEPGGAGLYRIRTDGSAYERIATLASLPVDLLGTDREVVVDYAEQSAVPSEHFEIIPEPVGVAIDGLGDSAEMKQMVDALSHRRRRSYTDGDVAWLKLDDGRQKIISTRGAQVCTLVPAGSEVAMARFSGWIYYVRASVLWRVPLHGGTAQRMQRVTFQPEWLTIREGLLVGRNDVDGRRWELVVGDGSPEASDKSGTSCDP